MIRVVHPGSRIRMLTFYPSRIRGSKRNPIPDPGSGSATLDLGLVSGNRTLATCLGSNPETCRNR
jgi:hypothetical protein